jgi:pimeloyl-ACP methyl ester carboxylesterase
MKLEFADYHRSALREEPKIVMIGKWRIEYLAFNATETQGNPPLLVLGGAFQNFNSFKFCAEALIKVVPLILVDLPSLGNNQQLAPELGMEDLADLLYHFTQEMELKKVSLMGLSLGSVTASTFAYKHPDITDKLIVTGIIVRPRKSWRMLLEESLKALDDGCMETFAQAVVLYLVNHARLQETEITELTRKLFFRQMRHFDENSQQRYRINANRLLKLEAMVGYPTCETLVATGEYDSFTLPYENAQFAKGCVRATFAIIKASDHVAQLERRDECVNMFCEFMRGNGVAHVDGIEVQDKHKAALMDKRGEPRYVPVNPHAQVISFSRVDGSLSIDMKVKIRDMSFFGCLLEVEHFDSPIETYGRDLILCPESSAIRLQMFAFEHDKNLMRCYFVHCNFDLAAELKATLEDPCCFRLKDSIETQQANSNISVIYR